MKRFILCFIVLAVLVFPGQKAHALDPKGKAFLVICTYGTVGGALLGFASMAFGSNSRAIAQGASLGLYAGIAFGTYVITSHGKTADDSGEEDPYADPNGPPPPGFGDPRGEDNGFGAPPPQEDDGGGFFGSPERSVEITEDLVYNYRLKNKKGRDLSLPIYINLLHATF